MGLLGCVTKCCACAVLSQLICLAIAVAMVVAIYLAYKFYLEPWGEDQIEQTGQSLNCGDCAGNNNMFPTNTTGFKQFLDTDAGATLTALTAISIAGGAVAASAASIAASSIVSTGATLASSAGFFEMLYVIDQAQFITLLGSLQLEGAPRFFYEFTSQLSWTNFQILRGQPDTPVPRRLQSSSSETATGVQRLSWYIGVEPDYLFYYTLLGLLVVCCIIVGVYFLVMGIIYLTAKEEYPEKTSKVKRRVVWAYIQLFILIQYGIAMTSSFQIYYSINSGTNSGSIVLAILVILFCTCGLIALGVYKISTNKFELDDVGSIEHEKKPFNHKYGPYYEDFNKENRYFFVAKIFLAILSGIVVGVIQNANVQIGLLIGLNLVYLLFLVAREPYIIRLFFYVGVTATFLRLILLLLTLAQAQDDTFPQNFRDNVAYWVIGINVLIFLLLIVRQLYVVGKIVVRFCNERNRPKADLDADNIMPSVQTDYTEASFERRTQSPENLPRTATRKPVNISSRSKQQEQKYYEF